MELRTLAIVEFTFPSQKNFEFTENDWNIIFTNFLI